LTESSIRKLLAVMDMSNQTDEIIRGENTFSLRLSSLAAAEHASSSFGLGNSTTGTSSSPLVFFVQQAGI